jgi:N-methylhydantoinase A/oxoprolinase/acetone carboxylase beta subunit
MRCDGGVMTVEEVRRRPIMTILSGPAAGVAGALMYEKLTDGIFLEVGGTSTDISCVKDGRVMIRYAEVGGHKTYLTSLDVRTVGIGGGSMVQIKNGKAVDVGPRSVHIAGLDYEVYTDAEKVTNPRLVEIHPKESDPAYACVECDGGLRLALSLAGAANIAGFAAEGDYARGNLEAVRRAWKPLADAMGMSVEEAAKTALGFSAKKNGKIVVQLMKDYKMDERTTVLVGGGGGGPPPGGGSGTALAHCPERAGYFHHRGGPGNGQGYGGTHDPQPHGRRHSCHTPGGGRKSHRLRGCAGNH